MWNKKFFSLIKIIFYVHMLLIKSDLVKNLFKKRQKHKKRFYKKKTFFYALRIDQQAQLDFEINP